MKVPEELLALNRHLMIFLIAVFAFVTKPLLDSSSRGVRNIFIAAIVVALLSFFVGYRTMFAVFNHYVVNKPPDETKRPPNTILWIVHGQYILTIGALTLLVIAIIKYLLRPLPILH